MSVSLDELIALLPEAGLRVWRCDQDSRDESWHVILEARDAQPPLPFYEGNGATLPAALIEALGKAGFNVVDDTAITGVRCLCGKTTAVVPGPGECACCGTKWTIFE